MARRGMQPGGGVWMFSHEGEEEDVSGTGFTSGAQAGLIWLWSAQVASAVLNVVERERKGVFGAERTSGRFQPERVTARISAEELYSAFSPVPSPGGSEL